MDPKPGEVFRVDGRASVQFDGDRALVFRVSKVSQAPTYHGWLWLSGYVLGLDGQAVEHREIYVQRLGLRRLTPHGKPAPPRPTRVRESPARAMAAASDRRSGRSGHV
jgi:hypothetical protein